MQTDQAEIARLTMLRDGLRSLEAEARALSDLSEEADDSIELQRWLASFRALKDAMEECGDGAAESNQTLPDEDGG